MVDFAAKKLLPFKLGSLGFTEARGGAGLVVCGAVVTSKEFTEQSQTRDGQANPNAGQRKWMLEVGWFGGSSFFMVDPKSPLSRVGVGESVALFAPMSKGKNGWRAAGEPILLEVQP